MSEHRHGWDICRYYVCDLVSGQVLDSLPLMGEVTNVLGDVGSQSWNLPIKDERVPRNWIDLLQPVRTMIACEWQGRIIQAWVVTGLKIGEAEAEIQAATLARCTEKVFVRTQEWYYIDEAQIAAEIVGQVMGPLGNWTVEWTPTGVLTDAYHDTEAAVTVRAALDTLSATDTGPRWRIDPCWYEGEEGVCVEKEFIIAHDLGTVKPDVVFTGYMVDNYTRTIDWTS